MKIIFKWDEFYDIYGKHVAYLFIALCLIGVFVMFGNTKSIGNVYIPLAEEGVLNLEDWDHKKEGIVELKGEWELYYGQVLNYKDFKETNIPVMTSFINLPEEKNDYKTNQQGYSTHRLIIRTSENNDGLEMGIFIPYSIISHRLMINNEIISEAGDFLDDGEKKDGIRNRIVYLGAIEDEFEIILNLSSSYYSQIDLPIYIGDYYNLINKNTNEKLRDMFFVGALFILGLYHIILYLFLPQKKYSLFLGILCAVVAIRTAFVADTVIMSNFMNVPFSLFQFINYAGGMLGIIYIANFLYSLYEDEFPKGVYMFIKGYSLLFLIIMIVLPNHIYSKMKNINNFFLIFSLIYFAFVIFKAVKVKREGSYFMMGGISFGIIAAISDVLYVNNIDTVISFYGMNSLAIMSFAFILAIMLSKIFSNAFVSVENLSIKLMSLDKLKDEFLANTSHELRTPLNGIIGITESLLEGAAAIEIPLSVKKNLTVVSSSAKRLSNLVNDILDYSKLKHRDLQLNRKALNLNEVVDSILMVFKMSMEDKQVILSNEIPENIPDIYADEDRLQQIIYNLVGNAVKFTESGEVNVRAQAKGSFVEIIVEDTGIGIAPEEIEDIFKSFEQVDASVARQYGGTGLGLSITKQLVELHNGRIKCESEIGIGSKFTFTMPVSLEGYDKRAVTRSKLIRNHSYEKADVNMEVDNDKNKFKVLVVDDEIVNLQVLASQLILNNYNVTTALSGKKALKLISEESFDLVILDVMMPKMSGYEVCKRIREKFTLVDLPVLMLTANSQLNNVCLGFECGTNDYIIKPFEKSELLARIKTLITMKNAVKLSVIDSLTGIFNRKHLFELAELLFNEHRAEKKIMSIIMMDIDNFKILNDKYGHGIGDMILKDIVTRCQEVLRPTDTIGRYGGEEFTVILPNTEIEIAHKIAERIRKNVSAKPIKIGEENEEIVTLSLGIGESNSTNKSVLDIFYEADKALYKAKSSGKNKVTTYQ
ncbi:diguanylate cyclase [Alkaliphilus peptidifermentans]|uniref:Circadian input-output histidine kinase CikA n=1 Tax=Alkaliphilus peptidifermentans DSM 18978 TaxID=1120976 RepID=A0A1G5JR49_9FIRM|nr:diguanylate cyclase [Alkaliphilus peptidifermentans]SCY90340.1 diguanylate cyclase (GGDEF) domain-containing protein [Alkaliphilus peptidifermentans DSM 18978]